MHEEDVYVMYTVITYNSYLIKLKKQKRFYNRIIICSNVITLKLKTINNLKCILAIMLLKKTTATQLDYKITPCLRMTHSWFVLFLRT